jgi:hypothetical protein
MPEQELRERIARISTSEGRQRLPDLIQQVYGEKAIFVFHRYGRDLAALVPLALLPKDEWRTMESAPRDGTVVLVAHAINGFIFTANWDAGAGGWASMAAPTPTTNS